MIVSANIILHRFNTTWLSALVAVWHGLGHVSGKTGYDVEEDRIRSATSDGVHTRIAQTGAPIEVFTHVTKTTGLMWATPSFATATVATVDTILEISC